MTSEEIVRALRARSCGGHYVLGHDAATLIESQAQTIAELQKDKEIVDFIESNRTYSDGVGDWDAWSISAFRKTVRELVRQVMADA